MSGKKDSDFQQQVLFRKKEYDIFPRRSSFLISASVTKINQ